jgi:thioredoxin
LIAWKGGSEQLRLESPTPEQVREAAAYVLGRSPAPQKQEAPKSAQGEDTKPIKVDESTFDVHVLRSAEPVLVDFWAPWCGPCRMIAPTLEKLSREYAGKLRIAKLNVDENPRLAAQYNASSIPLLVVFKGGRPVQRIVGAHPEPNLRKFVEQALR